MESEKAQKGMWVLIAPDGTKFKAESPLKCCRKEQEIRIPQEVAMDRLLTAMKKCWLCEDDEAKYIIAKGTPAEMEVCLTCRNTIFQHSILSIQENKIIMPHTITINHS